MHKCSLCLHNEHLWFSQLFAQKAVLILYGHNSHHATQEHDQSHDHKWLHDHDKAKKIIEDSNEDEWVLEHNDNSNLLLKPDDKSYSVVNSKKSSPINPETCTNNDTITNKVIDTTLLVLKA